MFTGIHRNGMTPTSATVRITLHQVSQIFQDRQVRSKFKAMPGKSFLQGLAELVTFATTRDSLGHRDWRRSRLAPGH